MGQIEELNKYVDDLKKELIPQMKEKMEMAMNAISQQKPLSMKNIKIDGIDCAAQLFDDKVVIVFPANDMPIKFYDSLK